MLVSVHDDTDMSACTDYITPEVDFNYVIK